MGANENQICRWKKKKHEHAAYIYFGLLFCFFLQCCLHLKLQLCLVALKTTPPLHQNSGVCELSVPNAVDTESTLPDVTQICYTVFLEDLLPHLNHPLHWI